MHIHSYYEYGDYLTLWSHSLEQRPLGWGPHLLRPPLNFTAASWTSPCELNSLPATSTCHKPVSFHCLPRAFTDVP